jgi:hypothetical protein
VKSLVNLSNPLQLIHPRKSHKLDTNYIIFSGCELPFLGIKKPIPDMSGVGWYQLYFFHSEASGILHRHLLIILFNGNYYYLAS